MFAHLKDPHWSLFLQLFSDLLYHLLKFLWVLEEIDEQLIHLVKLLLYMQQLLLSNMNL